MAFTCHRVSNFGPIFNHDFTRQAKRSPFQRDGNVAARLIALIIARDLLTVS